MRLNTTCIVGSLKPEERAVQVAGVFLFDDFIFDVSPSRAGARVCYTASIDVNDDAGRGKEKKPFERSPDRGCRNQPESGATSDPRKTSLPPVPGPRSHDLRVRP